MVKYCYFRTAKKNIRKNWSLPTESRSLFIGSVYECVSPEFTWALVNSAPVDTKAPTSKAWTVLVSSFIMDPRHEGKLLQSVMKIPQKQKGDACELATRVRHMLTDFTRGRSIYPGLRKVAPTVRVLTPASKTRTEGETSPIILKSRGVQKKRQRQRECMTSTPTKSRPLSEVFFVDTDASTSSVESLISPIKRARKKYIPREQISTNAETDDDDDPLYEPDKDIRIKKYAGVRFTGIN